MAAQGGNMAVLTLNNETRDLEFKLVKDLRDEFHIPERKNIYKVLENRKLEKIDNGNIHSLLKDGGQLETITDFTLG
jgi:hypothetical protein